MDELHTLSERLEQAALAELHAAAPPALRSELDYTVERLDGALLSIVGRDPAIVLNRVAGLGVEESATRDQVRRIRACYDAAGVGRHFVQVHPEARPAALRDWLSEAGYRRHRSWMKFVRGREAPPAPSSGLDVREIGPEHADAFGRIVAEGFDLSPAGGRLFAGLVSRPGWHLYMSFDGDTPAGTGALFVDGDLGWVDWGATTRSQRQRGSQSAIMARRIADALDLGCDLLFTCTGEWVEGDPQHSYRNIQRAGFREGYLRENYVPV